MMRAEGRAARLRGLRRLLLVVAFLLPGAAQATPDPLEPVNRRIHAFNALAQAHALGPLADLWRAHVPPAARAGLGQAVGNLGEPMTALSGLAAGDLGLAGHALARFGINTTLGWGGWRDAAAEQGFPARGMTPGDAACAWGVPSGPFLVLPLLGPTSLRDASAGLAAGAVLAQGVGGAPVAGWQGADAFLLFERLQDPLRRLEAESLDAYAALRSAWQQRRALACATDRAAAGED
jgi:phospholipid-binding lipoprotein MlaA